MGEEQTARGLGTSGPYLAAQPSFSTRQGRAQLSDEASRIATQKISPRVAGIESGEVRMEVSGRQCIGRTDISEAPHAQVNSGGALDGFDFIRVDCGLKRLSFHFTSCIWGMFEHTPYSIDGNCSVRRAN